MDDSNAKTLHACYRHNNFIIYDPTIITQPIIQRGLFGSPSPEQPTWNRMSEIIYWHSLRLKGAFHLSATVISALVDKPACMIEIVVVYFKTDRELVLNGESLANAFTKFGLLKPIWDDALEVLARKTLVCVGHNGGVDVAEEPPIIAPPDISDKMTTPFEIHVDLQNRPCWFIHDGIVPVTVGAGGRIEVCFIPITTDDGLLGTSHVFVDSIWRWSDVPSDSRAFYN